MVEGKNCDECDGSDFRTVNDSILKRQYPFVASAKLKMCENCGAKYVTCAECGALLTRVHLSTDVYGIRDECPVCHEKNEQITRWIEQGGGGFHDF